MRKLDSVPGMCRVLDYGVDQETAYLIMPKYKGSLRQWRLEQHNITPRLCLELFLQAICRVQVAATILACACHMILFGTMIQSSFIALSLSLVPKMLGVKYS